MDLLTMHLDSRVTEIILSRLDPVDICSLRCVSRSWLRRISRLRRRRRRSPLLVIAKAIRDEDHSNLGLFIEDDDPHTGLKLVFNFKYGLDYLYEFVASCRDLLCLYNGLDMYVYSPSTNQYLTFQTPLPKVREHLYTFAIVYVASIKSYKIVKLEYHRGGHNDESPSLRFEAITLQEDEHEGVGIDHHHHGTTCSWEFIGQHAMPHKFQGKIGNAIGVNGVVYTVATIGAEESRQQWVFSLGFEAKDKKFTIFRPPRACEEGNCHRYCRTRAILSQVKDLLCIPHATASSIDLWLLKDRRSCTWFKGYTISFIPPLLGFLGRVAYFPNSDDSGGLCIFTFAHQFFQYDICTKETTCLSPSDHTLRFLFFSDCLRPLKNGLTCPLIPEAGITRKTTLPPPPPPFEIDHWQYSTHSPEVKRRKILSEPEWTTSE